MQCEHACATAHVHAIDRTNTGQGDGGSGSIHGGQCRVRGLLQRGGSRREQAQELGALANA